MVRHTGAVDDTRCLAVVIQLEDADRLRQTIRPLPQCGAAAASSTSAAFCCVT
jgi:hypothetical protein